MKRLGGALCLTLFLAYAQTEAQPMFRHPQPGEIYREYSRTMMDYADWRVTDPNTGRPAAQANLPNATLDITIDDLQNAVRAEAVIDLWGGHAGTTGRAIRFNGNSWLSIPNLLTTPTSGECYLSQYNVTVDIPLSHLVSGNNTFQGTNAGQTCYNFDWGQHGMNGIIVRIYYGASKAHPTGSITSPGEGQPMTENPTLAVATSGPAAIRQVDFLAYYEGLDTDGDGVYRDWHHNYHRTKQETELEIKGHAGTALSAPFSVTWNTALVPDQPAGSIKLIARIQDVTGMWYVTDEVAGLSLQRSRTSVRLYKSTDVPELFSARAGREYRECFFTIPSTDTLGKATSATMLIMSWNGNDAKASPGSTFRTTINSWTSPVYGEDHFSKTDYITVPPSQLRNGTNTFAIHCTDSLTGMEVNWPGPQFVVAYVGGTTPPPPGAPLLVSPENSVVDQPTSTTLMWRSIPGAMSYHAQVALDAGFTSLLIQDSTATDTTIAIQGLAVATTHYWRVRARNAAGLGEYSTVWSFTTNAGAPALVTPADGETDQPVPVVLQWLPQGGALAYWLHLSTDSLFGGALTVNDSTILDTFRIVNGLQSGQTYYWKLRSRTVSGPGPFSSPWSFTTAMSLPEAVTLVAPVDQATVTSDSVFFTWRQAEPSATRYWLEIGFDSSFQFKTIDSMQTDTMEVVRLQVSGNRYSWRVRAYNSTGWGPFSPVYQFTPLFSGVTPPKGTPQEYSLYQNYPNPFNPSTNVTFGLPKESRVKLELYNLLGEHVMTVIDGSRAAGYYTVTVDASALSAGTYLFRLNADGRVLTRKMLLVK